MGMHTDFYDVLECCLIPEGFIEEFHRNPGVFSNQTDKGRITVKRINQKGKEGYILIENIKKI